MDDMGVLPTFTSTAIHDAFAPYEIGRASCRERV